MSQSDVKIPELTDHLIGLVRCFMKEVGFSPRDLDTLSRRTRSEGISFLTKTLPKLGKAFDVGLSSGFFNLPTIFSRRWRDKEIPAFCGSLFLRVFDRDCKLRSKPCLSAIKAIRQLCYLCYKVVTPLSDVLAEECLRQFAEVDLSLDFRPSNPEVLRRATMTIGHLLKGFVPSEISPKHGPGVTSNVEQVDKTEVLPHSEDPVVRHFGIWPWITAGQERLNRHLMNLLNFSFLTIGFAPAVKLPAPLSAKVIPVPKDSRGPRIISAEPCQNQFIQQGLMSWTVDRLESHTITRGLVNFTDQSVNQELARSGSIDQKWSTLDLKEASDRVSLELVKQVYSLVPEYLAALLACRTAYTTIRHKDGSERRIELKKFAPMGSAVCFTTLALVVWALCVSAISIKAGYRVALKAVTVFGDDVCVLTEYADIVVEALEDHGLLVNKSKSFINSRFLESCGVDAFDGVDVTPVKLKHYVAPQTVSVCDIRLSSVVAAANNLAKQGYPRSADYIFSHVQRKLGRLPLGSESSPYLCRIVENFDYTMNRTTRKLRPSGAEAEMLLAWVVESPKTRFNETGWGRLRRTLRLMGQELELPGYGDLVLPKQARLRKRSVMVAIL